MAPSRAEAKLALNRPTLRKAKGGRRTEEGERPKERRTTTGERREEERER